MSSLDGNKGLAIGYYTAIGSRCGSIEESIPFGVPACVSYSNRFSVSRSKVDIDLAGAGKTVLA